MDIFISYAYEDASLAEILKKELKKQDIIKILLSYRDLSGISKNGHIVSKRLRVYKTHC